MKKLNRNNRITPTINDDDDYYDDDELFDKESEMSIDLDSNESVKEFLTYDQSIKTEKDKVESAAIEKKLSVNGAFEIPIGTVYAISRNTKIAEDDNKKRFKINEYFEFVYNKICRIFMISHQNDGNFRVFMIKRMPLQNLTLIMKKISNSETIIKNKRALSDKNTNDPRPASQNNGKIVENEESIEKINTNTSNQYLTPSKSILRSMEKYRF
jgi:hypothetical protein